MCKQHSPPEDVVKQRPTPAEARIKRHMKQAERRNQVATRNAAKAAHRNERHTIASHLRNMGVDEATATGMTATLRKRATGGVKGFAKKNGSRRACVRYTRNQILGLLAGYKPRKAEFKTARQNLLALAA
ncbi:hypothetical protein ABZ635_22225 [Nocardiopsis sp. NPDC007018]|uniref:hypothetical protein n=1 Tax=Nocardiopsis sp. NPDC007018 TaxID=3155721 RepID=UPI0033F1AD8B